VSDPRLKYFPFKSGFELKISKWLSENRIEWKYEPYKLQYEVEVSGQCARCGSTVVFVPHTYTPDFAFRKFPLWELECKGKFTSKDRTKHWNIKKSGHMVRFVFQRDNKFSKTSKLRYSDWCKRNGIEYAIGEPALEWFK